MAEDFLEDTYREADAYTFISNLTHEYRNGNSDSNFLANINKYIQIFVKLSKRLTAEEDIRGRVLWNDLVAITKTNNITVCLDILEGDILPKVMDYLSALPKIEVDDEQGIILKSSKVGFIYQTNSKTGFRMESAVNPMQEAFDLVHDFYQPSKYKYILLGGGLGYIPYQLYLQSEGEIDMTVYFHDQKSYDYARLYGVLDWIPEDCISIVISDDLLSFLYAAKEGYDDFFVYKSEVEKYPSNEISALNEIIISQNTKFAINKFVTKNYFRNCRRVDTYIYDFDRASLTDKFLIIAGGPSVDDNLDYIRNCKKNGITTIAVGTVFKKLLSLDIIPDIVTACDPFVSVSRQFTDIDDNKGVPFFLGMGTDYRAAKAYTGPKILVPTIGIPQQIRDHFKTKVKELLPAGTTVTTFSYGIAAYLGAKEIYLVGADFGYPGGMSHANGTNEQKKIAEGTYNKVIANDGKYIEASPQMVLYRDEMVEMIANYKNIKTYNLSKHGAKIEGAKVYK